MADVLTSAAELAENHKVNNMKSHLPLDRYNENYRQDQIHNIAKWIVAGFSGSVVGLVDSGKSSLLRFLCYKPDVIDTHYFELLVPNKDFNVAFVLVDLNDLLSTDLGVFYRTVLRSFYEVRTHFEGELQEIVAQIYNDTLNITDPFVTQSAVRKLLFEFDLRVDRLVLVFDRFDKLSHTTSLEITDTLRGLHDSFSGTLCYIVGLRYKMEYFFTQSMLGELYELLDTHVCWVGQLNTDDAQAFIKREFEVIGVSLETQEFKAISDYIVDLTGGYPALLKAVCQWVFIIVDDFNLQEDKEYEVKSEDLISRLDVTNLLSNRSINFRLGEIWNGLTQHERYALMKIKNSDDVESIIPDSSEVNATQVVLDTLIQKGLCEKPNGNLTISSKLMKAYLDKVEPPTGSIHYKKEENEYYRGETKLNDLTKQNRELLKHFLDHPDGHFFSYEKILRDILNVDDFEVASGYQDSFEENKRDLDTNAVHAAIKNLRKFIEPDRKQPVYIITIKGKKGYRFFSEGRPTSLEEEI